MLTGVTPTLVEAMRSEHKSVATYASGVLKNLENDKPAPYRQARHIIYHCLLIGGDCYFFLGS